MKLIVSGATGFIGSTLIFDFLQRKENSVIALVRDKENIKQLKSMIEYFGHDRLLIFESSNLEQLLSRENTKSDFIVHLANKYIKNPSPSEKNEMLYVNTEFGIELAKIANQIESGFIYASSYLEYLDKIDQSVSDYVEGKQEFSKEIRKIEGLNIVENIVWDTYGKGDTRNKIVSSIINQVKSKKPVSLDHPNNLISLTHARDVASAITQSFSGMNNTFLSGSDNIISIGEVYEAITTLNENANSEIRISNHELTLFNSLRKTYECPPNWTPRVTLKEGILEMLSD